MRFLCSDLVYALASHSGVPETGQRLKITSGGKGACPGTMDAGRVLGVSMGGGLPAGGLRSRARQVREFAGRIRTRVGAQIFEDFLCFTALRHGVGEMPGPIAP